MARTSTAHVFRSGVIAAPAERGCEAASYAAADAVRPAGHRARTTAIFASPTLSGVTRWVRGNAMVGAHDIAVRQITVNPDQVYVYSVHAWERASGNDTAEGYAAYWASGILLSEWLTADHDPSEWEVLLDDDAVLGARPVSISRVAQAAPEGWGDETRRALERRGGYAPRYV